MHAIGCDHWISRCTRASTSRSCRIVVAPTSCPRFHLKHWQFYPWSDLQSWHSNHTTSQSNQVYGDDNIRNCYAAGGFSLSVDVRANEVELEARSARSKLSPPRVHVSSRQRGRVLWGLLGTMKLCMRITLQSNPYARRSPRLRDKIYESRFWKPRIAFISPC